MEKGNIIFRAIYIPLAYAPPDVGPLDVALEPKTGTAPRL